MMLRLCDIQDSYQTFDETHSTFLWTLSKDWFTYR